MTLIPYNYSLGRFYHDPFRLDVAFDQLFASYSVPFKVDENKDNVILTVALPGFKREDVKVTVAEGVLSVEAEKKGNKITKSVPLWDEIDAEKIEAELEDGLLTLTLKKKEKTKPKAIEIRVK